MQLKSPYFPPRPLVDNDPIVDAEAAKNALVRLVNAHCQERDQVEWSNIDDALAQAIRAFGLNADYTSAVLDWADFTYEARQNNNGVDWFVDRRGPDGGERVAGENGLSEADAMKIAAYYQNGVAIFEDDANWCFAPLNVAHEIETARTSQPMPLEDLFTILERTYGTPPEYQAP